MGTQKNRLNETVLLSTQNTCYNRWLRKYLQFYAKKFCLSKPVFTLNGFLNQMILPYFRLYIFFGVLQDLNSAIGPAPFSYEDSATLAREACDYSIKISLDEARAGTGIIGGKI